MKKVHYLAVIFLMGLTGFAQEILTLNIKENTVPCNTIREMNCLQVQEGKNKNWVYFSEQIDGFDYEPGFTYKLKVEKSKKTGNLPADASAYKYKLKKIVSKKKVKNIKHAQQSNLDIYGKKLVLTQLNGKPVTNGIVYFEMNQVNKSISGKSGVNRFNSSFEFKNNELVILPGMGTLMAGDPKAMELENDFLKALTTPFEVVQNQNEIKFLNAKTKAVVMIFKVPTENDIWTFINNKEWRLFALDNVGKDYGNASIKFNTSDNKVTGNNGCNRFFGSYSVQGDEISFKEIGSTRMACLDSDANETERKIMNYLNNETLRFDVADQTLNFYKNDRLVMVFGL